jgi:UDP-N-acetylmuramate dehydrogenase
VRAVARLSSWEIEAYMTQDPQTFTGLRGDLRMNEAMSRHVSWRAGGLVDRAYVPADLDDLAAFMRGLPNGEAVYLVGLGSNLLVRDGGLRGTVIFMHGALKHLRLEQRKSALIDVNADSTGTGLVYAEAGVASPKVARFAANHNLVGAEFLAGIPGTVGGALAMNAGCYGAETWQFVAQVLTVDRSGRLHERTKAEFDIGYRHVAPNSLREEWFAAAWFRLPKGDGEASRVRIKELLARRIANQPLNMPNAGSVFRNPPGDYAARLIEASGLKRLRIGGAEVSAKHANFIVNTGGATAADIESLIEKVRETVLAKRGVALIPEVRIIGEKV